MHKYLLAIAVAIPLVSLPALGRAAEGEGGKKLEWTPSADISETEKEYVIRGTGPVAEERRCAAILSSTTPGRRALILRTRRLFDMSDFPDKGEHRVGVLLSFFLHLSG